MVGMKAFFRNRATSPPPVWDSTVLLHWSAASLGFGTPAHFLCLLKGGGGVGGGVADRLASLVGGFLRLWDTCSFPVFVKGGGGGGGGWRTDLLH